MNRRSILRLLGVAPIAAPAAVAAATKAELAPVNHTQLASEVRGRIDTIVSFDGSTLRVPSLRCASHLEPKADGSSRFVVDANGFCVTGGALSV